VQPTLDQFIADWGKWPNNAWVKYPGLSLYVRRGEIFVRDNNGEGRKVDCLTIASVEAKRPGKGIFTKLVENLKERGLAMYVENAHNPRLRRKLENLGFVRVNHSYGPNYLWEPNDN
jgi:hypothetical protein